MSDSHPSPPSGYESSDTKGRSIYIGLAISVAAIAIVVVLLNELFVMTTFDVKNEQVGMAEDPAIKKNRAAAIQNISHYGWVDSANGVVSIPVERAMELMAEEAYQARLAETRGR